MEGFGREAAGTEVEMSLLPSFQLWNFSSTRALVERLPVRKWRSQVIFRNASSTGDVESFSRCQGSGDVN